MAAYRARRLAFSGFVLQKASGEGTANAMPITHSKGTPSAQGCRGDLNEQRHGRSVDRRSVELGEPNGPLAVDVEELARGRQHGGRTGPSKERLKKSGTVFDEVFAVVENHESVEPGEVVDDLCRRVTTAKLPLVGPGARRRFVTGSARSCSAGRSGSDRGYKYGPRYVRLFSGWEAGEERAGAVGERRCAERFLPHERRGKAFTGFVDPADSRGEGTERVVA